MRRRSVARALFFGGIVVGAFVLALSLRRGPRRPPSTLKAPAGGAVQVDDAGGPALVEDTRRYPVKTWSFSLERYEMRIEEAGMSTALDDVLRKVGAEVVVNGGFFDPDGKPVGLAVSDGVILAKLARNLSGGVITSDGVRAMLQPSEGFELPESGATRFAIQCRPRLVVDRAANVRSDDAKRAERTALCLRESGKVVDVVVVRGSEDGESPGPSLFALARFLVDVGCDAALNLDGGPSTGAAWREGEVVRLLAPRKAVRHVIAFRERR